ncbi:PP0621 family protein [Halothiobacillus sp.]|jgi:formylmethanofuran dehydrogenase subunit E|uniref:PP0621 family protein n=1 Tax=Halothiobacillus sp. TaxID=1891311 RepID=UPI002622BB3E|nr:PP0621 family protein [Halothiobacillus sp.]MDD3575531.1 PP0621 family protein [Halothiobacillus sp.]MDD4966308.1 PP0621 family protein [Halothiobacillus sp.]MDY0147638.1 PP0621 family protein [Halothiobacillus sp.]
MSKLLFWIVIILGIVGYVVYKRRARTAPRLPRDKPLDTFETIRCAECGVFTAKNKAVMRDGHSFCSWEHAQKWHDRHSSSDHS